MTQHRNEQGSSDSGDGRRPSRDEIDRWIRAIDSDAPIGQDALGLDAREHSAAAQRFAELQALQGTRQALRTWFALERQVLQAGPGPLDAVAVASARTHLGLDAVAQQRLRRQRHWPLWASGVAAGLLAGMFLWSRSDAPDARTSYLGGNLPLQFHAATGELELPPLAEGCFYRVEFLAGGQVVETERRLRQPRLRLPKLGAYPGPVRVRALLMQGGAGDEPAAWSEEVEVPAAMIR